MSTLLIILLLLNTTHQMLALCSHGGADNRPPVVNCVDPYTGVFRSGPSDPRWSVPSYPSYPQHGYYAPQQYGGNGYSYGYSDPHRAAPTQSSYAPGYGSYQRPYYPTSGQPSYGARITPYSQAMQVSQYPSAQPSQYYQSSYNHGNNYYPMGHVYHANHAYPATNPYGPSTNPYFPSFADPQFQMQTQFPGPNAAMKEGAAVMKGHPSMAVSGTIEFCQVGPTSVRVKGRITGIPGQPGNRGLHILKDHACPPLDQFPIDGKHMEHFNPFNSGSHGSRDSVQKHVGDLGNVFVQFDGVANIDFVVNQVTLEDPAYSIGNHSIVITDREDDLGANQNVESRLRGNSGRAVACGIIRVQPLPPTFLPPLPPFAQDQFSHRYGHYGPYPPNYPFHKK